MRKESEENEHWGEEKRREKLLFRIIPPSVLPDREEREAPNILFKKKKPRLSRASKPSFPPLSPNQFGFSGNRRGRREKKERGESSLKIPCHYYFGGGFRVFSLHTRLGQMNFPSAIGRGIISSGNQGFLQRLAGG